MPVKGQVSLGNDSVCSRAARNPFNPHIPKPDTVALSAAPRLDAGGEDGPASSIGGLTTAEQNAKLRTASTGLVGLNAYGQPRPVLRRRRTWRPSVRCSRARASAQQRDPNFFAAIVPAAKSISHAPTPTLPGGFVALPADRPCAESSNGNGGGKGGPVTFEAGSAKTPRADPELGGKSVHRSHGS